LKQFFNILLDYRFAYWVGRLNDLVAWKQTPQRIVSLAGFFLSEM
jgi:hypothetical protein